MQNFHALKVKYLFPTNFNGSRIRITSHRFKQSITIPFDYSLNRAEDMAEKELIRRGFNIIGSAEVSNDVDVIFTDTFLPLKEKKCVDCKTLTNRLSGVDRCPPCTEKWVKA